jgi:ribosome-associated protein
MALLTINSRIQIPHEEFTFTFVRSSGPGGQNVNKVNSKAVLRWPITESRTLPPEVRQRFISRYGSRLTTAGELILSSQRYRDQGRNTADCLEKLKAMVSAVAVRPIVRKKTKPTRGSVVRRLEHKGRTSHKKQQRQRPAVDE